MDPADILNRLESGDVNFDEAIAAFDVQFNLSSNTAPDHEERLAEAHNSPWNAPVESQVEHPTKINSLPQTSAAPSALTPIPARLSPLHKPTAAPLPLQTPRVVLRNLSAPPPPASPAAASRVAMGPLFDLDDLVERPELSPPSLPPVATKAVSASVSEAVRLSWPSPGVAVLSMEDRGNRNMFSAPLVAGLLHRLEEVRRNPDARVMVVHGYDTWFCAGGTPQGLDDIREGRAQFTDFSVFRALLDFELPTIAAMQGHALGGGLTFGLYADIIVLSESAYYAGNFLAHGFTPGVGATAMFPMRFGDTLGRELLLTARRYRGSELRERGSTLKVLPADEVIPHAVEVASGIAQAPRLQLTLLKRRLAEETERLLRDAVDAELDMHRQIFSAPRQA
jgi:polyketide biosynthesis enoyl-CoA hydratase PksI